MNRKDEQTPARFNNSKEKKRRLLYGRGEKKCKHNRFPDVNIVLGTSTRYIKNVRLRTLQHIRLLYLYAHTDSHVYSYTFTRRSYLLVSRAMKLPAPWSHVFNFYRAGLSSFSHPLVGRRARQPSNK